jgi:exodeoxyribonuclease VII large subunit
LTQRIAADRARLAAHAQLLGSLGYKNVLARGFALVRDDAGLPVRAATAVAAGQRLSLEFADGRVAVREGDGPASPRRAARVPALKPDQGDLF